jgi:sugar lactone lactonase YvrE
LICVDFCFLPSGEIALLEVNDRSVLLLGSDGAIKGQVPVPFEQGGTIFLGGIECDAKGRLYVTNTFDNSVIRFDLTGKSDGSVLSNIASSLVMDAEGAFYGTRATRPDSFRHFQIVKEFPFEKKQEVVVSLEWEEGLSDIRLVGRDDRGNLYLEAAFGGIEHPDGRKISVYSKAGKRIQSNIVPPAPMNLAMVRSRAVAPSGGYYCVRVNKDGFGLQHFTLLTAMDKEKKAR